MTGLHESVRGTFETCRAALNMSGYWVPGKPEAASMWCIRPLIQRYGRVWPRPRRTAWDATSRDARLESVMRTKAVVRQCPWIYQFTPWLPAW